MPLAVVSTYIRPYINNIYSAKMVMHFLVAHGYETPALITQTLCGNNTLRPIAGSTVILASADVASF